MWRHQKKVHAFRAQYIQEIMYTQETESSFASRRIEEQQKYLERIDEQLGDGKMSGQRHQFLRQSALDVKQYWKERLIEIKKKDKLEQYAWLIRFLYYETENDLSEQSIKHIEEIYFEQEGKNEEDIPLEVN